MTPDAFATVQLEALSAVVGGAGAPPCVPGKLFTAKDRELAVKSKLAAGMSRKDAAKTPSAIQANNRCALGLNPWDVSKDPHVPAEDLLR